MSLDKMTQCDIKIKDASFHCRALFYSLLSFVWCCLLSIYVAKVVLLESFEIGIVTIQMKAPIKQ